MQELQLTVRLKIQPGKLSEFTKITAICLNDARKKDKGTTQYDWFLNENRSECVIRERFKDSTALLEHIANQSQEAKALFDIVDRSLEVYGTPSEILKEKMQGMNVKFYSFFQGL